MTIETIQQWPRLKMLPSLLQPRTNFPSGPLNELGLTMRQKGVQQPLLVRLIPSDVFASEASADDWGVWSRPWGRLIAMGLTREAADHLSAEILGGNVLEIADGERRWRAADERPHPGEALRMEAMDELPVIVREMTDVDVLELMLVSAIQRAELTELEECDAFHRALAQRNADGTPANTVASLCAKLGGKAESYVRYRLGLRKLPPEGREGLRDEKFSFRIARELCAQPAELVPELLDVVLHPKKFPEWREEYDAPLTLEELQELIQMKSRVLDRAPFDLKDAHVLAVSTDDAGERLEGGPCADCPFNTAVRNSADEPAVRGAHRPAKGGAARCLHPGCYDRKVEIHVSAALIKLEAAGATVLKGKDAERVLHGGPAKGVSLSFVELDAKLAPDERAKNIDERHAPTWRAIVTGTAAAEVKKRGKSGDVESVETVTADLGVTPTVIVDGNGQVRQFVERKVAAEAAQKTGTAHLLTLSSGRGVSVAESDEAKRNRLRKERERDAQKVRSAASRKIMEAVAVKVELAGLSEAFWPAALALAVRHAGNAGCVYVAGRRGIARGNDVYAAVKAAGAKLKGNALKAFIVELLLAQDVSYCDSPNSSSLIPDSAKPVLKLLGVDPGKIKKTVERDFIDDKKRVATAAKEKAKKTAKPAAVERPKKKGKLSPADRAGLIAALKARWAARKLPVAPTPAAKQPRAKVAKVAKAKSAATDEELMTAAIGFRRSGANAGLNSQSLSRELKISGAKGAKIFALMMEKIGTWVHQPWEKLNAAQKDAVRAADTSGEDSYHAGFEYFVCEREGGGWAVANRRDLMQPAKITDVLPPERTEELAKIEAMHIEGREITVHAIQTELKLRGTKHAEWLLNRWKKMHAPAKEDKLLKAARQLYYNAGAKTVPALQGKLKIGYQRALALFDTIIEEQAGAAKPDGPVSIGVGTITSGLKPRKKRAEPPPPSPLGAKIIAELTAAGEEGMDLLSLAERAGDSVKKVEAWLKAEGRKISEIARAGGKFAWKEVQI